MFCLFRGLFAIFACFFEFYALNTKNLRIICEPPQADRPLDEVECIIPDIAGQSRGKSMPAHKFAPTSTYYLPISLFCQTISGEYVDMDIENQWLEVQEVLGAEFCKIYANIKRAELEEYQREISPWERNHLLLQT